MKFSCRRCRCHCRRSHPSAIPKTKSQKVTFWDCVKSFSDVEKSSIDELGTLVLHWYTLVLHLFTLALHWFTLGFLKMGQYWPLFCLFSSFQHVTI